ncbi:non-ribosomal peptide synthetase [Kineosporia sp. J2-2]|uniref:Non-ribosomal peptide synthetase n=1 Tax=Kineosporia corallincola TaxID=2835133 RepID=A0ABS5TPT5_9ACTN|nr:non-ribosomal peptide synthetase [Kineosporia corallincola]MBT0772364.1 non-ribosomal peptide synthetase [Kineosporia corallincola]
MEHLGTPLDRPDPETAVPALVGRWAVRRPDAPAVRDPLTGETLNYRELWLRAGRLAAGLNEVGVRPSDLVAVAQNRSVSLVVTLLGILRAGAAYLPLDAMAPADRLAGILQDSGVRVAVCAPRSVPDPSGWRERLPDLTVVEAPEFAGEGEDAYGGPDPAPGDPAYVAFTSGSTGRPKGVVVPHRAVRRLAVDPLFCTIEAGDRVGNAANPAFDATTFEIWNALIAGGTVVVLPGFGDLPLDDWIGLTRAERLDALFLTTSLFHTLARERPGAFSRLGTLVVGGEQLELGAVRRVLAAGPPGRLVNGYGPTETTTFAAYFDCNDRSTAGLDRIPVGRPLQQTSLHVLDERLAPVPDGELGELCVGGPGLALGYLGRPELTAEKFVTRPGTGDMVYRTGDLARTTGDGVFEVLGRRDRQVKLRGFRIELEEIERAAVATGLVDTAFVEKVGEGPAAVLAGFALPAPGTVLRAQTLTGELTTRLPAYMLPSRWLFLERLPIGPTGKTDRAALLALLEPEPPVGSPVSVGPVAAAAPEGPADEVDDVVATAWRDVLGVSRIGAADNFLDLGGNSILAMQVAARIQDGLSSPVDAAEVLLADTLADLCTRVRTTVRAA